MHVTDMSILDYCAANPASVSLTSNAADAIEAMIHRRMGAAAVVDEHGIVAGIFTERDVMTRVALCGRDSAPDSHHRSDDDPGPHGDSFHLHRRSHRRHDQPSDAPPSRG